MSDEDDRCSLTELRKTECQHCRAMDPLVWEAKYEGICRHPTCQAVIEVGEAVKWNESGTGVMHASHR